MTPLPGALGPSSIQYGLGVRPLGRRIPIASNS